MMSTAEAKKQVLPRHYAMYRELGGGQTWNRYHYIAAVFVKHTLGIFVQGDCAHYQSRQEAVQAFQTWADQYGDKEDWRVIFQSIDLVDSYT